MLVLKRMSAQKIITYVSIIAVMVGATGLVLYKNRVVSYPESPAGQIFALEQPGLPGGQTDQPDSQAGWLSEAGKITVDGENDFAIFASEKFKALRRNILIPRDPPTVGRRDPFKSN